MFSSFRKNCLSIALAVLSFSAMNTLAAWDDSYDCCESNSYDCCPSNRLYIGGFGGGIYSDSTKFYQMGTAFFTEAEGGPLAVLAKGSTKKNSTGFGGAQIGYEWNQSPLFSFSGWSLAPAVELEALFFKNKKKGHLFNETDRLPEHDFIDSFHMDVSTCMANLVFTLKNSSLWGISPYVGGGIGAAHFSAKKASSIQVDPPEAGINHFNSKRNDSSWAFAAQAKAGLNYKISERLSIFGEYRYLFIDSSNYIFGSTVYPTHAPTSPWNVKMKNTHYNAFAFGLQLSL